MEDQLYYREGNNYIVQIKWLGEWDTGKGWEDAELFDNLEEAIRYMNKFKKTVPEATYRVMETGSELAVASKNRIMQRLAKRNH